MIIISIGLWLQFFSLHAQDARLFGIITDKDSGKTIPGVNIFSGDGRGTLSDTSGFYQLTLPAGEHKISYRFLGYSDTTLTLHLSGGEQREINIALREKSQLLSTVVVSASRYEQKLADSPVSMEVLPASLIDKRNSVNLDESLQLVPGVIIVNNEPQIRSGSGFSFGAGSRVMVLVDDIPILSGDIGRPSWGFLPIENVEQVEIIKGPGSVLYGSGALSGVINLRTAFPREEPRTRITIFSGIYDSPQSGTNIYWKQNDYEHQVEGLKGISRVINPPLLGGLAALHTRRAGKWDLVFGANTLADMGYIGPYYRTNSNGDPVNFEVNNGDTLFNTNQQYENRARINANVRYRIKKGLFAGINFNALTSSSAQALLWAGLDSSLYRPFQGALTKTIQQALNVDPYFSYTSPDGLNMKFSGRILHFSNNNDNNQNNESETYYGEYQIHHQFDDDYLTGLSITGGVAGSYVDSRAQLYNAGSGQTKSNEAENLSFYAEAGYRIFNILRLNAGWRNERYRVNSEVMAATIFRAGLTASLAENTHLRASYGEGIRFPTIGEQFINTSSGGINIFPNPALEPERSYSTEIGIRQGFRVGNLKGYVDAAAFYQQYEDFIEFTFGRWSESTSLQDFLGLGFKSLNTGRAEIKGLDLTVAAEHNTGKVKWQWMIGYTYTIPKSLSPEENYSVGAASGSAEISYLTTSSDTSNHILKYRMQHLIKLDSEWMWKKFTTGISFRFQSFMQNIDYAFLFMDTPQFLPSGITKWREENRNGDFIFDLRLYYSLTNRSTLGLVVNNLLNREYTIRPLAIEQPRTILLRYQFAIN